MSKKNITSIEYSLATIFCTAIVGQIIIIAFPDGNNIWSSVLFISMNLMPMMMAIIFSLLKKEVRGIGQFFKKMFFQKESIIAYIFAVAAVGLYYGISAILKNISYTGNPIFSVFTYLPWALVQGGLEEVGWRGYLQTHLNIKNNIGLKFFIISIVWFVWHLPLYRLPWITAASSNYFIFYLMILGNTFTFGAIKEVSKGTLPCILAHLLIDSLAVVMLVQSNLISIIILVMIEIVLSFLAIKVTKK